MGEKEQGGMLRVIVVVGLIAIIAMTLIFAVVNLKSDLTKNTNKAVGTATQNYVIDSEISKGVVQGGSTTSWYQPTADFNYGSWAVAGKYKGSNYIQHLAAANESRSDVLSARIQITGNDKTLSYGVWVKGHGRVQISGFRDVKDGGPGNSWRIRSFNSDDWTYISENDVFVDSGDITNVNYISLDIVSLNGSPVAFSQPMMKFTKDIGSIDYMLTD